MRFIVALMLFFSALSAHTAEYVGNAFGVENRYQVFEFNEDGMPYRLVTGSRYAAWPSSVIQGPTRIVYASDYSNAKWNSIRRYTALANGGYTDTGQVLAALPSETSGIGPATVTKDETHYRIFFTVRSPIAGKHYIGLAKSQDGQNFSRQGYVYEASASDTGAISVSYACSYAGVHYLLVHSYSLDMSTAKTVLAAADDPDGPYVNIATVATQDGLSGTISGSAGNNFAVYTGDMTIGLPIVVNGNTAAPYIPVSVKNGIVYFDRPLVENAVNTQWGSFTRNKADLSFIRKTEAGWEGAMTGYGSFDNVNSEYTNPIRADDAKGPWFNGRGYFLYPYFNSGRASTENPEPMRKSASCAE